MKPPSNMRRLKRDEVWQENDWFRVDRGIYCVLTYRNVPIIGCVLCEKVGKETGYRLKDGEEFNPYL